MARNTNRLACNPSSHTDDIVLKVVSLITVTCNNNRRAYSFRPNIVIPFSSLSLRSLHSQERISAHALQSKKRFRRQKKQDLPENISLWHLYGLKAVNDTIKTQFADFDINKTGIRSTIYAVKPGDWLCKRTGGNCQKVLGGWKNIAGEYATKEIPFKPY